MYNTQCGISNLIIKLSSWLGIRFVVLFIVIIPWNQDKYIIDFILTTFNSYTLLDMD